MYTKMKVLSEEFGERSIYEWIGRELQRYHEEKYGEKSEVMLVKDDEKNNSL
jgi:hypothetical protein